MRGILPSTPAAAASQGAPVPRRQGFLFSAQVSNHLQELGVFPAGAVFHPGRRHETKLQLDETILVQREDVPKRRVAIQLPIKRRAGNAQ
jgi:hypothetical protein